MSNKKDLQENNLDLQGVLQVISTLPSAKKWNGGGYYCTG